MEGVFEKAPNKWVQISAKNSLLNFLGDQLMDIVQTFLTFVRF
jgi:hypothetical protein